MPISTPAQATIFNDDYENIGGYVQDDSRIPFYNEPNSGEMFRVGEPFLVLMGEGTYSSTDAQGDAAVVFFSQGIITSSDRDWETFPLN